MPRKYTKRSEYWEKFKKNESPLEELTRNGQREEAGPELIGEAIFTSSEASRLSSPNSRTSARTNAAARNWGRRVSLIISKRAFYRLIILKIQQTLRRL
jgi:hypothetical protein